MTKKLMLALLVGGAVAAVPAAAQEQKKEDTANNPNRVICQMTRPTGSRFPVRVCRTWAEWEAARTGVQDSARDIQDRYRGPIVTELAGPNG